MIDITSERNPYLIIAGLHTTVAKNARLGYKSTFAPAPHPSLTGTFRVSSRTLRQVPPHYTTTQRRVQGVPVLLHDSGSPQAGDIGYFLNGHVLRVRPLRFVSAASAQHTRAALVTMTREMVLDLFQSVDRWHAAASVHTSTVVDSGLTSTQMIFISAYRPQPHSGIQGHGQRGATTSPSKPKFTQGLIHYYKIRRRWIPGRCNLNATCDPVFPTRSLLVGGKDPQYEVSPFDPVDELLNYIMNTPMVDRDGIPTFPGKAVASVADLFTICEHIEKMPNSVREIHDALRQLKPRIRVIKGTDIAAFELACVQFERNSECMAASPIPSPPRPTQQRIVRAHPVAKTVEQHFHAMATAHARSRNLSRLRAHAPGTARDGPSTEHRREHFRFSPYFPSGRQQGAGT